MGGATNPSVDLHQSLDRAAELIDAVKALIVPFVRAADEAAPLKATGNSTVTTASGEVRNALVDEHAPEALVAKFKLQLPDEGRGKEGALELFEKVLKYSVNTWDQGFMDKLYSSNTPVGVIADLLLSVLNTNLHVYQVSPALSLIEKLTAKQFAGLFGFTGPRAGGVVCQGGSSSNFTSLVVARNTLYPETKVVGNAQHDFALFTSVHGHYSVEKSAISCGMGSSNVIAIPVDEFGCMIPSALREAVVEAKERGKTPLYVNATAGTTVLGSYDPLEAISEICKEFNLWMHVDGSWGGPAILSHKHRGKLVGSHLADSLTVNPHKMLSVPVTCSFLLTPDIKVFHAANSLPAGYLFHSVGEEEPWDLADLTLQCGRRGDAVKLALAWTYYGAQGFEQQVDHAFNMAAYMAGLVDRSADLVLVSSNPPPCLQVCFYYAPGSQVSDDAELNTRTTRTVAERLVARGFMIDYAPGEKGSFFRVVVNTQTLSGTVEGLVKAIQEIGREVWKP
ncbi:unnamed protein product [Parascedosporium putredinis]|uniref:Glutamate decarboxylase n=1 Tax=Parascedosporium putredinis TaxID=1442378 RepID=A0A9P1H3D0_9PEZI|nr:unnamed protein product [Parascedosporium putredinis]CAI7994705.1 unnamed protein product [Parascedosporium putredinis]